MPKGGKSKLQSSTITHKGVTWIDVINPSEDFLKKNPGGIRLHPLDIEDILSPAQRPKLERQDKYLFLIFRFPRLSRRATRVRPTELDVVITPKKIITFHGSELPLVDELHSDARLLKNKREDFFAHGSAGILRLILQKMFEAIYQHTDEVSRELDGLESHVFSRSTRKQTINEIAQLRRKIIDYRRIAKPQSNFLKQVETAIRDQNTPISVLYWRNLIEITDGQWELLENYKETIIGLGDTHSSLSTYRLNQIFRLLTIISVMFIPATFVIDLFDLSVPGAPFSNTESGFLAIVGIVVVVELIFLGFLRRKRVL